MEDAAPISICRGPAGRGLRKLSARPRKVFFDRLELSQILKLYGAKVAAGEWCDYAISGDHGAAVFSVYGSASAMPLYSIVKRPGWMGAHGAYAVISTGGRILKMGPSLARTLRILEPARLRLVDAH